MITLEARGQKKLMHTVLMSDWLSDRPTPVEKLMNINGHPIKCHTARLSELRKIYRKQGFDLVCLEKNHNGVRPTFYTIKALEILEEREKGIVREKTRKVLNKFARFINSFYK